MNIKAIMNKPNGYEIVEWRYKEDGKIVSAQDHFGLKYPNIQADIYSVKRLSDDCVFTVGDKLCGLGLWNNETHKINSMELINGTIGLNYGENGAIIIQEAKKVIESKQFPTPTVGSGNVCSFYEPDNTTGMNCKYCKQSKWMHCTVPFRYQLFNHMAEAYNLNLINDELDVIINIVNKISNGQPKNN